MHHGKGGDLLSGLESSTAWEHSLHSKQQISEFINQCEEENEQQFQSKAK